MSCWQGGSRSSRDVDPAVGFATLRGVNRLLFGDDMLWSRNHNVFPGACVDFAYLAPTFIQ